MADKNVEKVLDKAQLKAEWQKALPTDMLSTQSLHQLADFLGRYFDLVTSYKSKAAKGETTSAKKKANKIDFDLSSELNLMKRRAKELLIKYIDYVADLSSLVANKTSASQQPEEWSRSLDRVYEVYFLITSEVIDVTTTIDELCTTESEILETIKKNLGLIKEVISNLDSAAGEAHTQIHPLKLGNTQQRRIRENPHMQTFNTFGQRPSKLPSFIGDKVDKFITLTKEGLNDSLIEHLNSLVTSIFSAGRTALLQDNRFAALKSIFALKNDQRLDALQNPAMGMLFKQFNFEVQQWTAQKMVVLTQRLAQQEKSAAGGDEGQESHYPYLKYFLLLLQAYFKQRLVDFKAGIESAKPGKVVAGIEATVLQKIDKEVITAEELLQFSDYFTLLAGKTGKEDRKEIAKKILKNSNFSGIYKKNLMVQDKFGNSLLSMALAALPEKERETFLKIKEEAKNEEIQTAPEVQKKKMQEMKEAIEKAKKQNDLNDYLQPVNSVLLRRRLKKTAKDLEEEKKRVREDAPTFADTSFTQYMKDPARKELGSQLCFEGVAECFPARYPRNSSEQAAFYQKIVVKFGDQLGHYLDVILKEYVDFSNTTWIPVLLQALEKHKVKLSAKHYDHISSRLISNAMPLSMFKQIKLKSLNAVAQFGHRDLQNSQLGKQIKDLFQLGFKTVGTMKDVIDSKLFESKEDNDKDETPETSKTNRQYLLLSFIRREVPRQLLLYYALFGDAALVKSTIDRLNSELTSTMPDVKTVEYLDYLMNIGTQTFFQLLPELHSQALNIKDLNYELVKAVAFLQDFKATEVRAGMYLGLLHDSFKPFKESDLAQFVLNRLKPKDEQDSKAVETAGYLLIKSLILGFNSGKKVVPLLLMAAEILGKFFPHFDSKKWLRTAISYLFNTNLDTEKVGEPLRNDAECDLRLNGNYSQAVNSANYSSEWLMLRKAAVDWRTKQSESSKKTSEKALRQKEDPADRLIKAKEWRVDFSRKLKRPRYPVILLVNSFCKQALEVMPSFFQEQGDNELLKTLMEALFKLSGRNHVFTKWLKFVARNYARGSDQLKAFCAFIINSCMKDICDSSSQHQDSEGGKSPLIRNIFIETAIKKGWASDDVKVNHLLKPILAADKKSSRLTQEQLLNVVLLADYSDFRAVALSTAFTDDFKLIKIMGIKEAGGDQVLKAELLKLLKVPGMNRHCLKYLTFAEGITVKSVASHAKLEDMMTVIAKLNDADFEKIIPLLWKHYQAEKNSGAMMVIYMTAWVSGSLSKLCTVLRCTDDVHILGKSFNDRILDKMFTEKATEDNESPLSYFLQGMNAQLGRLLAISMLAKESIPLMPTPPLTAITESNLVEYLNRGQTYFGFRFLKIREQIERALGIGRDSKPPINYMNEKNVEKLFAKASLQTSREIKDAKTLLPKLMSAFASTKPLEAGESLFVFADEILYSKYVSEPQKQKKKSQGYYESRPVENTGLYVAVLSNKCREIESQAIARWLDDAEERESGYKSKSSHSYEEESQMLDQTIGFLNKFYPSIALQIEGHGIEDTPSNPSYEFLKQKSNAKKVKVRDLSISKRFSSLPYSLKSMSLLVKLYNQEGRPKYLEAVAKVCAYLIALSASCPKDVGEVARSIKDPKRFMRDLADAYLISLTKPKRQEKNKQVEDEDEEQEQEQEPTTFTDILTMWSGNLLYFGLMFVTLVPDKSVADQLLASLKSTDKESLEKVYRLVYLQEDKNRDQLKQTEFKAKEENQRKLAERKGKIEWSKFEKVDEEISSQPSFNKASLDLVKNFLEQSKAQTVGPLRDQIAKELEALDKPRPKTALMKTATDIMELLDLIHDNTLVLGANPGLISNRTYLTRINHHELHFTPEFIKETFKIDPKLAASKTDEDLKELQRQETIARTKLLKASALWNSAINDVMKISPLSLYTTDEKYADCMSRTTNPFNVLLDANKKSEAQIFVCNKGQKPPSVTENKIVVALQVWFDVTKAKEEVPVVKINYLLSMTEDRKTFEFNPKQRPHSSLFDLMALHHWVEKDLDKTLSRIGGDMKQKLVDPKQGYQSCSLIKLPNYDDRPYFRTKFDDNLIGHTKHNKKFEAKLKLSEATASIYAEAAKLKCMTNEPVNVGDQVAAVLSGKSSAGSNQKTNSSLSAWEATVRSF